MNNKAPKNLSRFDHAVIRHVQNKGKTVEGIFTELVNMIGKGNGEYVKFLCKEFGFSKDMLKVSQRILNFKAKPY